MFLSSGIRCVHAPLVVAVVGGHHCGAKKGTIMEPILVLAIVAIVCFGLYRFMRTRTAH
jgi:hypothetical protein